jgi:hypothetical protein
MWKRFDAVRIDFDTKEFEKTLSEVREKLPYIAKDSLVAILRQASKDIKARINSQFQKHKKEKANGTNLRNIKVNAGKGKEINASIGTYAKDGKPTFYASFLERGVVINPKDSDGYLTFFMDGAWHKVKQVTIPARPFFKPVIEEYFSDSGITPKAAEIMDKLIQQKLNKYEEKHR